MNPTKRVFITVMILVLAMAVIACSCSSLIPALQNIQNPLSSQKSEPMPGLAGSWQDPETSDLFVIAWENDSYVIKSITWESKTYEITSQSWDGSTLTWSYYDNDLSMTVTYQTTSLSGDNLNVNWSYSDGSGGTETLTRQ